MPNTFDVTQTRRFASLTIPLSGWSAALYYFVCTVHRALSYAEGDPGSQAYLGVCNTYTAQRRISQDPLVSECKWATYSKGTGPLERWTIFSVKGTEGEQWRALLTNNQQASDSRLPGQVHAFMLDAAQRLWNEIGNDLRTAIGNGRCLLTGHSLGGAIALLIAWFLRDALPAAPAGVVSIGAPRIGNLAFASPAQPQPCPVVRLENTGDVVTSLPPCEWVYPDVNWGPLFSSYASYRHAGAGYVIDANNGVRNESDWASGGLASTVENSGSALYRRGGLVESGFNEAIFPHLSTEYARRIRNTLIQQPSVESFDPAAWQNVIDIDRLDMVNRQISFLTGNAWRPQFGA